MIKKRGKDSWLIKIYLGRGPDGKEKRYVETFRAPLRSMAVARERELKAQFTKVGRVGEVSTLGEWLDIWLKKHKNNVTPRTFRDYESAVRRLKPIIGRIHLYTLDSFQVMDLLEEELGNLAPKSRKNYYSVLRLAIKAALDRKLVPGDALQGLKSPKIPRKEKPVLTREQLVQVATLASRYKHGLIIQLLCATGARVSEILGLTWNAVDFSRNTITIDQSVDITTRQLKSDVKTKNSRRTIELPPELMQLLKEHKQKTIGKVVPFNQTNLLVFTVDGKPVRYNTVRKTWVQILKKAGLPAINIHAIRHSVITLLLNEGVPPIVVAGLVGHDVATTVNTYAQKIHGGKAINIFSVTNSVTTESKSPKNPVFSREKWSE